MFCKNKCGGLGDFLLVYSPVILLFVYMRAKKIFTKIRLKA